ncbi:MAG: sugar ABC transporter substrate-binding protein, partial [Anaerolineae bacterium]|nr:sugar ABC transporter substrate-binding protein [Anaerolineae bacterium]
NFEASVSQDLNGIGSMVADLIERHLAGETLTQRTVYIPTKLVTQANVADMMPAN